MTKTERITLIKATILASFQSEGDGILRMARRTTRSQVGDAVGHMMANGYLAVTIPDIRIKVYVHQVIYFLTYGIWGAEYGFEIDHEDRCRTNNQPSNLRLANDASNARNSSAACVSSYRVRKVSSQHARAFKVQMKTGYGRVTVQGFATRQDADDFAGLLRELAADAVHVPPLVLREGMSALDERIVARQSNLYGRLPGQLQG